ncbi:hypothetical protein HHI36_014073 [Cryptolaemus montrouzieri]
MGEVSKSNSVRAMINLFESRSQPEVSRSRLNRPMSKSFSSLSNLERQRPILNSSTNQDNLNDIEKRLARYNLKIENYRSYTKEDHISFQYELIEMLSILVNDGDYRKLELMEIIQSKLEELNEKLPNSLGDTENFTYKPFSPRPLTIGGSLGTLQNVGNTPTTPLPNGFPKFSQNEKLEGARKPPVIIGGPSTTLHHSPVNEVPFSNSQRSPIILGGSTGILHSPLLPKLGIFQRTLSQQEVKSPFTGLKTTSTPIKRAQSLGGIGGTRTSSEKNVVASESGQRPKSVGNNYGNFNSFVLGGNEGTLRSPEINGNIAEVKTNVSSPVGEASRSTLDLQETLGNSKDDSLASVELLKRFFELKATDKVKLESQNSFDAKSDQREIFSSYVENLGVGPEREDENEDDDAYPVVKAPRFLAGVVLRDVSESENENDTDDFFTENISEEESSNVPIVREVINETIIPSLEQRIQDHPDVDETCSISSERSIYVDPVE